MDDPRKQHDFLQKSGVLDAVGLPPGATGDPFKTKYGRKGPGCLAVVLIVLILLTAGFFVYPLLTPDRIRGDIVDCVLVPQKDSTSRMWILTNGSFEYISSTKTPGSYSVGRKCLFCKAWLYEYDPLREKVIRKIKIPYEDIMINSSLFYDGDTVMHISGAYHREPPKILSYNAYTGEMVEDTAKFAAKYPELTAGITAVRFDREKNLLSLDTKDGRTNMNYALTEKKLYPSYSRYYEEQRKDAGETETCVLCAQGGERMRQWLYKVRASRSDLLWTVSSLKDNCESNMEKISKRIKGAEVRRLTNQIFLRGIIYYQDPDGAVIISVNQTDKKADRMITLINREGKVKWVIPQSELFKTMKIDEDKGYWSTFDGSARSIRVSRSGNLLVLLQEGAGIMGFDYATGKKLFTLE